VSQLRAPVLDEHGSFTQISFAEPLYPRRVGRLPIQFSKAPIGRERLSPERAAELQRGPLIEAAIDVFAKRGFREAKVEHIADAAGISVGSIYSHFEGKEDCLLRVHAAIVAEARERIATAAPPDGDWAAQACAGIHALLVYCAGEPRRARVALIEVQTGGQEAARRYSAVIEEATEFLRRGRDLGQGASLPPTFEEATASGLAWLLQERLAYGSPAELVALFREVATIVIEPYLGADEADVRIEGFAPRP
jgi:AcrR family transcriptional regulator